jgi:hypothetical protein
MCERRLDATFLRRLPDFSPHSSAPTVEGNTAVRSGSIDGYLDGLATFCIVEPPRNVLILLSKES